MLSMRCSLWKKMHVWAEQQREEQGGAKFDEWVQWLCDQMMRAQRGEDPAYEKYRDWTPKRTGTW